MKKYGNDYQREIESLGLNVIDIYSCKGFDTYGMWKLIGGTAKKHPNRSDIEKNTEHL